jgi:hypothetical protein
MRDEDSPPPQLSTKSKLQDLREGIVTYLYFCRLRRVLIFVMINASNFTGSKPLPLSTI